MKALIQQGLISLYIFLFTYTAVSKILDYDRFKVQVGQSPLLTGLESYVPAGVIFIEVLVAVLLVLPRLRRIGLFVFLTMMVMFTTYVVALLKFSPYLPCSCGGVLELLSWREHLIFNVVFIGLAMISIYIESQTETQNNNYEFARH